ncbi:MAG: hypothetical protein AAF388_27890 [Bacteroidota bacterium]
MIPINVRGILFLFTPFMLYLSYGIISKNSMAKEEYQMHTGIIQFLDTEYLNFPARNHGEYRYLELEGYPYVFEIYEPNSEPTPQTIDNLKLGDEISIFFYETDDTRESGMNRFAQFVDHKGKSYFIRNAFKKHLGYALIGIAIFADILCLYFWKKGKFPW